MIHAFVTLRREFAPAILHLGKLNRHILTIQKSRPVELAKLASRRQSSTVETSCLASISAFAFQGTNAHAVLQDDKTNVKFDYEKPSLQVWNAEKRAFHVPAHPMLLQVSSQDDVTQRFWARFNATASQSYLFDHQINGRALAPAAGMLELASASVRSNSPSCPLILYTLGIFSPLILEMDETNTVVTCDLDICAASFQIGSNCRIGSNARGSCGPYSICNGSRNSAKLPDLSPEAVIGRLESAANWGSVFGGENDATWTPPPALDAAFQLDFTRRNKLRSGYLPTDTFVPVAVNVYVSPINFSRLAGDFVTAAPSHHRKGELSDKHSSLPPSDHHMLPEKSNANVVRSLFGLQLRRIAGTKSEFTARVACESASQGPVLPVYATELFSTAVRASIDTHDNRKLMHSMFHDSKKNSGSEAVRLSITGLETAQHITPSLSSSTKADLLFGNVLHSGVLGVFRSINDELSTDIQILTREKDNLEIPHYGNKHVLQDVACAV